MLAHTHTHSLSKDWQIAINVQTWKVLHKQDQDACFTLAASLTWGMSSSSFRISLNWNKRTLCKSVSIWTDVCQDLVSDSCHVTQDTQQAVPHVHLLIPAAEIKQCLLCVCCWTTWHCQIFKHIECCTTIILCQIYVAGKNEIHIGLQVERLMLHWNKRVFICSSSSSDIQFGWTDCNNISQCAVSQSL